MKMVVCERLDSGNLKNLTSEFKREFEVFGLGNNFIFISDSKTEFERFGEGIIFLRSEPKSELVCLFFMEINKH